MTVSSFTSNNGTFCEQCGQPGGCVDCEESPEARRMRAVRVPVRPAPVPHSNRPHKIWQLEEFLRKHLHLLEVDGDGCWIWQGTQAGGRGRIGGGATKYRHAWTHRAAWEAVNGPVPADREVYHLCGKKLCCRPDCLAVGTHAEVMAAYRPKTCQRGHDDWRIRPDGRRECVTCRKAGEKRRRTG